MSYTDKIKLWDIVLVFFFIIISFSIFITTSLLYQKGEIAVIVYNSQRHEYPLNKNKEIKIENVANIFIKDGEVWFENVDCPDKLCERMGKISGIGDTIICVPNKLYVIITSEEAPDAIAG